MAEAPSTEIVNALRKFARVSAEYTDINKSILQKTMTISKESRKFRNMENRYLKYEQRPEECHQTCAEFMHFDNRVFIT